MLWPLDLPFKITFLLLMALVASLTALAPAVKWKRSSMFGISLAIGCLAFVPSCVGIMVIIDARRFGVFQYDSAHDVNDLRVARFLPARARNIILKKYPAGHLARYSISKADLLSHLDALWDRDGRRSAMSRDQLGDGESVPVDTLDRVFTGLNWPALKDPIEFHGPVEKNGGGATYYLDADADTVYHRASYW